MYKNTLQNLPHEVFRSITRQLPISPRSLATRRVSKQFKSAINSTNMRQQLKTKLKKRQLWKFYAHTKRTHNWLKKHLKSEFNNQIKLYNENEWRNLHQYLMSESDKHDFEQYKKNHILKILRNKKYKHGDVVFIEDFSAPNMKYRPYYHLYFIIKQNQYPQLLKIEENLHDYNIYNNYDYSKVNAALENL